ncbi:NACHT, LRR and PYD domains-containing protein 1a-like [Mantella aurantiaca]
MKALEMDAENSRRHFVDEHQEALINEIDKVDGILEDLLEEDLLSDAQYNSLCRKRTSQEKMRQLYIYVFLWDAEDKDIFLGILKTHNRTLIANLQRGDHMPTEERAVSSETSVGSFLSPSRLGSSSSPRDEMDCDLCGKNHDPADIPIMPKISGNTFRLELRCAGRFCCLETGIKFQVTGPVTIEYELDNWYKYMDNPRLQESEVMGPLFNIKTLVKPGIVSAVYLPHYLCLEKLTGDKSGIKCAHFKDGNLSVETPTQILPFHVVLENPSFSSLVVIFWNLLPKAVTKYIPIHGKVLLYCKTAGRKCVEYKIHLYLMPAFAPIDKEFQQEKANNGFKKIDKPPRTKTIYSKKNYIVNGPMNAHVEPKELEVQCVSPLESYTDITINAAVKMIDLHLVPEAGDDKVWGCRMSRGEVEELQSQARKRPNLRVVSGLDSRGKERFVERYREALISSVPLVDPILDSLVTQRLLADEEYDNVRSKTTTQEKMRELFRISRGWGSLHKGKLYDALEKHNAPLLQHLLEHYRGH